MQTIYKVNCEIISNKVGLVLRRTFLFPMKEMMDGFINNLPANTTVTGYGIDHLMTNYEAITECIREQDHPDDQQ